MRLVSKAKTLLVGVAAMSVAALTMVAPAQATDFDDDDGVEKVVVVKKRVARPIHDFDDDDFDRARTKRVIVEKRIVRDFDDDDFHPRSVVVKRRFVERPRTLVVRERVVRPAFGFHDYDRPRSVVVRKRVIHSDHGFYGPRRAGIRAGFDF